MFSLIGDTLTPVEVARASGSSPYTAFYWPLIMLSLTLGLLVKPIIFLRDVGGFVFIPKPSGYEIVLMSLFCLIWTF